MPGEAALTSITGVVVDNQNQPIPGVRMRLFQTHQGTGLPTEVVPSVATNAVGTFTIQPAPVGAFKLMADGSVAPHGPWPTLEFDIVTVAGQVNDVGLPIYLPRLDPTSAACVNETTGGTVTLPQVPGFKLVIAPGAATFPGGARSGCVTVTPVNADKVPMAPGFGQQPRFVVTIQPVGTIFNPPAQLTLPNVDGLAPRAVTEMYSYDHDLAAFVAIGTGTVSEDGSVIVSDPGVGVIKAGWHCGGNPNPVGSAGECGDCKKCVGTECQPDPSKTTCDSGNGCCKDGRCVAKPSGAPPTSVNSATFVESIIPPASANWGETKERELIVDVTPHYDAGSNSWKAKVTSAELKYTIWYRLIAGVSEASTAAATTNAIYCTMREDLRTLGYPAGRSPQYYMVSAVEAHERQHVVEMHQAFDPEFATMKATIEGLSVPYQCGSTADQVKAQLKGAAFTQAVTGAFNRFVTTYYGPGFPDPNPQTDAAEHAVVDPVIAELDKLAAAKGWKCQ